jgi:hypothetical protein
MVYLVSPRKQKETKGGSWFDRSGPMGAAILPLKHVVKYCTMGLPSGKDILIPGSTKCM